MTKINYDALDAVAEALEGDWVAEGRGGMTGTNGRLARSDGLTLTLWTEDWSAKKTAEVSGYGHSINVNLERDPKAVARDIARQLIPGAHAGWVESKAAEEAALEWSAGVEAVASALGETGFHRVTSCGDRVKLATRYRRHGPMGDWEILGPESVNVELRYLTAAQAAEVAHLVAGWGE